MSLDCDGPVERMGRARRIALAVVMGASTIASSRVATAQTHTLTVPGRTNANVSIAADGTFVAIAWSASLSSGSTDIYVSTSQNAGKTFSVPIRANTTLGDARVNGEQPPRVALARGSGDVPEIAVIWTAKGAAGTVLVTS